MIGQLNISLDKKFINLSQGVQQKLTFALTMQKKGKTMISLKRIHKQD